MLSSRKTFIPFINTSLRFYYAERFAALPKIESRIKKISNQEYSLALSTTTPSTQWFKNLFNKNWRHLLIIRDDTLGYNAQKDTPANPYEFRCYYPHAILEHPVKLIDLKQLYAIPQETWDAFIDKLQHQVIVDKLGLRKHRHLWAAYSQHQDLSIEARIQHAEWIGKYHFLISLYPLHRREMCEVNAVREQFLQLTKYGYSRDNSPLAPLTALNSTCTPLFFKKVAHIPLIVEVLHLATLTRDYATTYPMHASQLAANFIDAHRQQNAINWLPSSKDAKETVNTEMVLYFAEGFQNRKNGSLFFATRMHWQAKAAVQPKYPPIDVAVIEDYLFMTYQDLISREIHRQLNQYHLTDELKNRLYDKFKHLFSKTMIDHATYKQLEALQSRWHHHLNVIAAAKPSRETNPSWSALTDPQTINHIKITALTSEAGLKAHGNDMHHCVGGYTNHCLSNQSDIFELKDEAGECSTLEIGREQQQFIVKQHRAKRNLSPSLQHTIAANQFIDGLNNKTISVNQSRFLDQAPTAEIFNTSQYTDKEQETLYAAYRDHQLLPTKLIADNHQAMLTTLNLQQHIQTTINTALEPNIRQMEDETNAEYERENRQIGGCLVM